GEVLKTIVFAARDFPDWRWQVPVTANVTAAAWTDPPALDFALDHNDEATRTKRIVLHRRKDVAIGRVVASQPGVIVKTRNATNESLQLEINISSAADKSGEALAQVFDPAGTSQLLAIPITWRPRPWLRCVPQELVLDRSTNASRIHKKRIMLLTCLKQKETIKAEPL